MVHDGKKKSDNGFHMAVLSVDWCWELMFFALLTALGLFLSSRYNFSVNIYSQI